MVKVSTWKYPLQGTLVGSRAGDRWLRMGAMLAMGWESKILWTLPSATVPGSLGSSFQHLVVEVLFAQSPALVYALQTFKKSKPHFCRTIRYPSYFVMLQAWQDVDVP